MGEAAKVIKFEAQGVKSQLKIVNQPKLVAREKKYKKNGEAKKTPNNAKINGSTRTIPIREGDDITRILDYIQKKIDGTTRKDYEWQWERNKLYFCMAIYSGFRVSDMVGARTGTKYKNETKDGYVYYTYPQWTGLKWSDIFCKDGKVLRKKIEVKELKTGKIRVVKLNEQVQGYIMNYVNKYHPDTKSDDYIFLNRQGDRLSYKTIDNFIKEVTQACGMEGRFSTHTLRKTCIFQRYLSLVEQHDEHFAIKKCMEFTGHESVKAFFHYLTLDDDEMEEDDEVFEKHMDKFFDKK